MKHFLLTAWCLMAATMALAKTSISMPNNSAPFKIMVISDIHLLAPSLLDDGKAAMALDAAEMKLVLDGDLIMQRMVDDIILRKPQLLLIAGDLTLNGERASHERLAQHLGRLQQAGVRTLVIPGNHDVMCPYSKQYTGDAPAPVACVDSEEFASIYHDYGYGANSRRDPNSLSYTCEPVPGLVLLCIDSNRYASDRDSLYYHTDGAVKPATLDWIKQQLAEAQASGKRVIAMMHHHLLEHIDGEAKLLPNYIVAHHNDVARVLSDGGVKVVFTGHLHITDAVASNGITDVATGSASTYPLPMRMATIDASLSTMTIETQFFGDLDSSIIDKGRDKIEGCAPSLSATIARRLWPLMSARLASIEPLLVEQGIDTSRLPRKASDVEALISKHMAKPLSQSLMMVTCGGEDPAQAAATVQAVKQGVRGMVAEVFTEGADEVSDFLFENFMPRVENIMRSALEDINGVGTPEQSSTPDHSLVIGLK